MKRNRLKFLVAALAVVCAAILLGQKPLAHPKVRPGRIQGVNHLASVSLSFPATNLAPAMMSNTRANSSKAGQARP